MRALALVGIAVVILALPSAVGADSVKGSATAPSFLGTVKVDAISGPGGEDPAGRATFDFNAVSVNPDGSQYPLRFGGSVSCLEVHGNAAVFNIQASPLLTSPGMFDTLAVRVTDGAPDVVVAAPTTRAPRDCSRFDPADMTEKVTEGDLSVVDAPAYPARAAGCRHGHHKRYGFKSRRQCVAAVHRARRGR